MKIANLYNVLTDASNLLDFFERVETPEQLVSRLERLKRQDSKNMMDCIDGLRGSIADTLDDTLEMMEMSAPLGTTESSSDDDDLDGLTDADIASLNEEGFEPQKGENSAETPETEKQNSTTPEPSKS